MQLDQTVKFVGENRAGLIHSISEDSAEILSPDGTLRRESLDKIELVKIAFEAFKFIWDRFTTRIPKYFEIGEFKYCLHVHYDFYEKVMFAFYKDTRKDKVLIGVEYGKNTNSAKRKLKSKLKEAGYL